MNSLGGNVGSSEDDPLKPAVDELQASGENVWIDNDKSVIIDSIIGGDIDLTVDGDVLGGDPSDGSDDIIGGDVDIDAIGSIGSEDAPLEVESDEISASGDDIHLDSDGDVVIDKIEADGDVVIGSGGSVTDKGEGDSIIADDLQINAGGSIGTEEDPLNIRVPGKVETESGFGGVFMVNSAVKYNWQTVVHEPTGTKVTGYMDRDPELIVTDGPIHGDCPVCRYLASVDPSQYLIRYRLELTVRYFGGLLVELYVGEEYNGQILTVVYCEHGFMKKMDQEVKEGYIRFQTDRLLTYMVMDGIYSISVIDGAPVLVDQQNVPVRVN